MKRSSATASPRFHLFGVLALGLASWGMTHASDQETLIQRVHRAMRVLPSYRVEGTLEIRRSEEPSSEVLVRAELEGVGRSNGDGRMSVEIVKNGEGQTFSLETRSVGGTRYVRSPVTGEWEVGEAPPENTPDDVLQDALLGQIALEDVSTGRGGFVDGEPTIRIEGTAHRSDPPSHVILWVADRDLRLRRVEVEGMMDASRFASMIPDDIGQVLVSYDLSVSGLDRQLRIDAPDIAGHQPLLDSPFGPMAHYKGTRAPVRFEYPAGWRKTPPKPNVTASFVHPEDGQLVVSEEVLATSENEPDTLRKYVELVLSVAQSNVDDFELLSSKRIKGHGLRAHVLTFRVEGGDLTVRRFIYLYDKRIGINVTYLIRTEHFERMEPIVDYSQASFELVSSSD